MRTVEELEKENAVLRGLLPALNAPCVHCGLTDIGRCARGFPGCAQADDLLVADQVLHGDLLARYRQVSAELEKLKQSIAESGNEARFNELRKLIRRAHAGTSHPDWEYMSTKEGSGPPGPGWEPNVDRHEFEGPHMGRWMHWRRRLER